jgi:hypothetical protein
MVSEVNFPVKWQIFRRLLFQRLALKQNIQPLVGGMSVLNRLRPVEAEYNGVGGTMARQRIVSLVGQEVRDVLPQTVKSHRGKLRGVSIRKQLNGSSSGLVQRLLKPPRAESMSEAARIRLVRIFAGSRLTTE